MFKDLYVSNMLLDPRSLIDRCKVFILTSIVSVAYTKHQLERLNID